MTTLKFTLPDSIDIDHIKQYLNKTTSPPTIDQGESECQLKERQEQHLRRVKQAWQPCLHDQCTRCHGTGINAFGSTCIHMISCKCPKCSFTC